MSKAADNGGNSLGLDPSRGDLVCKYHPFIDASFS